MVTAALLLLTAACDARQSALHPAGSMQIVNTVVYVRSQLELGETAVATAFATAGAGSMVAALLLPRLVDRLSERPIMLSGGLLITGALLLGLFTPSFSELLALWFLIGAGMPL
jgi:MFS family permease